MTLDLTAWDSALKIHYVAGHQHFLAEEDNPFLGIVKRDPEARGKKINYSVLYQGPGGGSALFATAKSRQTSSKPVEFTFSRAKNYQLATLDNETIEAGSSDKDAYFGVLEEVDRSLVSAGWRDERNLFRGRGGWIGRLKSTTNLATAVAVLDDPADAFCFQIGMECAFGSTNGTSGSLRDSGATLGVSNIDRESGEITFDGNLNTISGIANTDYVFQDGDFGIGCNGLDDWFPVDRSILSTAFGGVTRSVDEDKLGGLYRDAAGEPLVESLIKGMGTLDKHGARAGNYVAWMNPETLTDLALSMQGKTYIDRCEVKNDRADIGYAGFDVVVGRHKMKLMSSWACKSTRMYLLDMSTIILASAGPSPRILERGGMLMQNESADTYEARVAGYRQLICKAPVRNMVIKLA